MNIKYKWFIWIVIVLLVVAISCKSITGNRLAGYTNQVGNYGFNYPTNWNGYVTGTDMHFDIQGIKIDVVVEPASPEDNFDTILSEITINSKKVVTEYTTIDGEQSLRQDFLEENGEIIERIYTVFYNEYKYTIMIMAMTDEEQLPASYYKEFTDLLEQFESMVQSFRFMSSELPKNPG